jgi:hypothetical protein
LSDKDWAQSANSRGPFIWRSTDRAPAGGGQGSGLVSLNLAREASTIFLSILQNQCYGCSFDQKKPPIEAGFNEAGMVI